MAPVAQRASVPLHPVAGITRSRRGRLADAAGGAIAKLAVVIAVLVLIAPVVVVVFTSFNRVPALNFPPQHWSLSSYRAISSELYGAMLFSIKLGLIAAAISVVLGLPASFALARASRRLAAPFEATFRLPLQMPQLVMGLAAFQFYVILQADFGLPLRSTWYGLLVAHVIMLSPYVVVVCIPRIATLDPAMQEAAESLGAGKSRVFWRVVFPTIRQAVFAAFVLAFLVSFDNVPLSLFLTSPGSTTFPVALFDVAESSLSSMLYAAASVAVVLGIVTSVVLDRVVGLRRVLS